MQIIYPGTSGTSIVTQSKADVNVKFAAKVGRGVTRLSEQALQLELFPSQKPSKPQISSIPGVSPAERSRYQVKLRDEILGFKLTIDEAVELAKSSEKISHCSGLEAIGSILSRLPFVQEGGEA